MKTDLFKLDCECGCAAKIPAERLIHMLRSLSLPADPALIIGPETLDDAGVYRISDDLCLIQTVDFFPPVARDPHMYGKIAAANALSDVYAMGGRPLTALAIVCFPTASLGPEVLKDITAGAVEVLRDAKVVLAGGHSIVDPAPKFGLAVTGVAQRDQILTNAGARPGNALILTKPLGTGTTILAAKAGIATAEHEEDANRCMATLNAEASQLALAHGASSCTDITGFGFLGHAVQMGRASGVAMEISMESMPMLEQAVEFAGMGLLSAAAYANRRHNEQAVRFADDILVAEEDILFDPQTSGGLLIAVPGGREAAFMEAARRTLSTACAVVGRVTEKQDGVVITVAKGRH